MKYLGIELLGAALGAYLLAAPTASATTITEFIDARAGPWVAAVNPSFNWGTSTLAPESVSSLSGLAMTVGDTLTITYLSGIANGGGSGIFGDANGNAASYGNLAGSLTGPGQPSYYVNAVQYPIVYFMAVLGAFTNASGVIVGRPFLIGDGPSTFIIPAGATTLYWGFNDGNLGFFDNTGGVTMTLTEGPSSIPEPWTIGLFAVSIAGLLSVRYRSLTRRFGCRLRDGLDFDRIALVSVHPRP